MASILGVTFFSSDLERLLEFYRILGLSFDKKDHMLSITFSTSINSCGLLEIAQRVRGHVDDAMCIEVPNIEKAIKDLGDAKFFKLPEVLYVKGSGGIYIHDPDGRQIFLVEEEKIKS